MKMCKKIALVAMVFILSVTLSVYAGVTEIIATASATEVKVGDTVTITLTGKCGTGIEGIDSTLEYDTTKLKLINEANLATSGFTSMSGVNEATGKFKLTVLYGGSDETPTQAEFATLTFEVLEGAKANENLDIKISEIELGDSNNEWIGLDDQVVTIKVLEDEENQNQGNGDQNPDEGNQNPDTDTGTQNPDDGKDHTTVDGNIIYAGIEDYIFIILFAVTILSIVLYIKSNKYKDIK